MAFAVTCNHWLFLYSVVLSAKVISIYVGHAQLPTVHRRVSGWVGEWVALTLDPSSQKIAFLNIYSPHHLKDPSLKRKKKEKETKVSIFNMSQQRLQFVLLLTVTHRIKTIVITNEKLNSQW